MRSKTQRASLDLPRHPSSTICYYYHVWSDLTREQQQQLECNNGVKPCASLHRCVIVVAAVHCSLVDDDITTSRHIPTYPQHVGRQPGLHQPVKCSSESFSLYYAITMRSAVQSFFVLPPIHSTMQISSSFS